MPFRTTGVAGQGCHLLVAQVRLAAAVLDVDHLRPALQRHHVLPSGHHRHMIEQWLAGSWGEREDVALQAGGEALEDRQHVIAIPELRCNEINLHCDLRRWRFRSLMASR